MFARFQVFCDVECPFGCAATGKGFGLNARLPGVWKGIVRAEA